ncbi:MAG TPA: hypothetical protein PK991_05110 [Candidatus Sabulitectum sp.]|nr:hypothetical protein [Candidatus Sabulitectum sp.]
MLNLLKLPDELIQEVEEMGDHWQRRLATERILRRSIVCQIKNIVEQSLALQVIR